jgi:hypothetical protein
MSQWFTDVANAFLTVFQVRAKSVLLRDLNQLQSNKTSTAMQPTPPQPVEAQSKSPINIDLESSPAATPKPTPKTIAAPVPAMDVDMSMANGASATIPAIKGEAKTPKAEPQRSTGTTKPETTDVKPDHAPAADDTSSLLDSNFTDMEFTLAPTADDPAQANTTQPETSNAPTLDLTSFATNDASDDNVLSLESLESSTQQQSAQPEAATTESKPDEAKKDASAKFEDIFGNDASQADGMDFDFSLGGGMGDDTFDDLMNDRDGTFEMMNNEDFDAAFFGLDGSNNES